MFSQHSSLPSVQISPSFLWAIKNKDWWPPGRPIDINRSPSHSSFIVVKLQDECAVMVLWQRRWCALHCFVLVHVDLSSVLSAAWQVYESMIVLDCCHSGALSCDWSLWFWGDMCAFMCSWNRVWLRRFVNVSSGLCFPGICLSTMDPFFIWSARWWALTPICSVVSFFNGC